MENRIITERAKIMNTVKIFRENLTLHGDKITGKRLKIIEKSIKFHEDLANDESENDIEYFIDRSVYFKNLFNIFLTKYNIDHHTPE